MVLALNFMFTIMQTAIIMPFPLLSLYGGAAILSGISISSAAELPTLQQFQQEFSQAATQASQLFSSHIERFSPPFDNLRE